MEIGSTVTLKYRGTLDDGSVFGKTEDTTPMIFQTGMECTIPGFEKEILQMNEVGEKKTFTVGMYDAYGEYLDGNIQDIPRQFVPIDVKVGQRIWMADEDGERFPVTVLNIAGDSIKFDMNHPLAGKDLTFEVEILKIEEPPENFVPIAQKREMLERQMPGPVMN